MVIAYRASTKHRDADAMKRLPSHRPDQTKLDDDTPVFAITAIIAIIGEPEHEQEY